MFCFWMIIVIVLLLFAADIVLAYMDAKEYDDEYKGYGD